MSVYLKRVIASFVFIAGLVVVLMGLSKTFTPKGNVAEYGVEDKNARAILAEPSNSVDVIIFGDSESYSSISPMEIWKSSGIPTFVCGTRAQRLDYTQLLVERALGEQLPKIVVLETNALYRKISADTQTVDFISEAFPIFKYHNRWKLMMGGSMDPMADDSKGFHHYFSTLPAAEKDYMAYNNKVAPIPETNKEYVKTIKKLCDDKGVKLLLLSAPSMKNWNYKRHTAVSQFAEELGCEYLDLNMHNKEIKIDWETDTRDEGDHVNYYGAVKTSKFLAEYFMDKGIFSDKRKVAEYNHWNEALHRYENSMAEAEKEQKILDSQVQ